MINKAPNTEQKRPVQTMTITFDGKSCAVNGPLHNPFVCYAMLQAARDVVYEASQRFKESVPPKVSDIVGASPSDLKNIPDIMNPLKK